MADDNFEEDIFDDLSVSPRAREQSDVPAAHVRLQAR